MDCCIVEFFSTERGKEDSNIGLVDLEELVNTHVINLTASKVNLNTSGHDKYRAGRNL